MTSSLIVTPVGASQLKGCGQGGWYLEGNHKSALLCSTKSGQWKKEDIEKKSNDSKLSSTSVLFAMDAADGGLFEVLKSQLALSKSVRQGLLQTARIIRDDHDVTNKALQMLAGNKNLLLPTSVSPKYQALLSMLQDLNGPDFEAAYINIQIQVHQQAIDEFRQYMNNGESRNLRKFAKLALPMLQYHLKLVKRLRASSAVGSKKKSDKSRKS